MEVLFNGSTYRVTSDPQNREYKTRRGALARKRELQERLDARPLPDNIYRPCFSPIAGSSTDLGRDATVIRLEFLHKGYTAAYKGNSAELTSVAGPALIAEWRMHGGRDAWKRAGKGPRKLKTDRERVKENQKSDRRFT